MPKWADYLIAAKRTNDKGIITHLQRRPDKGESAGAAEEVSKATVVRDIEVSKTTYMTATKNAAGDFVQGAKVRVYTSTPGFEKYLRTDANGTAEDNLGNLPEF